MTKRVFVIHGWEGYPEEGWFPWLKGELEAKGFRVEVPAMPDRAAPRIEKWVWYLVERVDNPDKDTFLIGHSIGCQTILRYLQTLKENQQVGGVVLVAGFTTLTPAATPTPEEQAIARPWLETPIDWDIVKHRSKHFTAIFSNTDPFVPIENAKVFASKLDAEVIIEQNKGHFSGSDSVRELPSARDAVLRHAQVI